MGEVQGQAPAQRVGNVMICGLNITECLLAASGENVLQWGGRLFRGESWMQRLLPAASCSVSRWWMACAISNERECQLWGWKGLSFTTQSSAESWERILTTVWHFRSLCLYGLDSWGPPPRPSIGHLTKRVANIRYAHSTFHLLRKLCSGLEAGPQSNSLRWFIGMIREEWRNCVDHLLAL